jgi:hypothetical protein
MIQNLSNINVGDLVLAVTSGIHEFSIGYVIEKITESDMVIREIGSDKTCKISNEMFYRKNQMQRNEMFERVKECSNPEQALHNYMNDDLAFGKRILEDAKRLDLKVMEVENESDIMNYVEDISSYFNLF